MSDSFVAAPYLRDNPRITYVEPHDPWLIRTFVSTLEVILGRKKLEGIYNELKQSPFSVEDFFTDALNLAKIHRFYPPTQLDRIPRSGPLVFVANHPFGVVDGLILCELAAKTRGEFRILINALLCQDKDLAPYFLPIDFSNDRQAMKTNIRSKNVAKACLEQDIPIIVFPSGMVSTADRRGFGRVVDGPWSTFTAKLVRDTHATVVPVFFHGQNSRLFHVASHIALPLRMALLVNEALNKFHSAVEFDIGEPINWNQMEMFDSRLALTQFLYQKVQDTGAIRNGSQSMTR